MAGGGVFAQTTKTTEHKHCVCGAVHKTIGDHTAEDADASKTFQAWESDNKLPDKEGRYYLTKDVVISETWQPADGTVLCLNGKTITGAENKNVIKISGEFTLTDCAEVCGSITGGRCGVYVNDGKTFNMYNGLIKGNGRGVFSAGYFNMYGGSIIKNISTSSEIGQPNISNGAGVYILSGMFTINGNVQITGNLKYLEGDNRYVDRNVYAYGSNSNIKITVGEGGLGEDAHIGLVYDGSASDIVNANETDYSSYFTVDNTLGRVSEVRRNSTTKKLYFASLQTQDGFNFDCETEVKSYGDNNFTKTANGDDITYSSHNTSVAKVDKNTGVVTIVGAGTAIIKAIKKNTDPESPNYRAYYNLTVTKRTAVAGDFDFTRPADLTYDGNPKTAQVALDSKYTGCGDITVKYYDESGNQIEAVNAGTYKVKIDIAEGENFASVKDLYVGTFTVDAKQLEEGMIADIDAQTYTGNTITPEVTVTDGSRTLVEGADYDVTYEIKPDSTGTLSENKPIGAGTYNVIITGKGNYSGAVTKPFAISAKQEADVIAPEIRVLAGESREVDLSSYKKNATDVMRGAHSYDNVFDRSIPPYKVSGEDKVGFTIKSDAAVGDSGTITVGVESADGNTYYDIQFKVTVRSKYSKPSKPPVQKPSIATGEGFKAELSSDGTKATITVEEGYEIVDVLVNGISKGKVTEITGLKTGDTIEVKTEKKQPEPVKPADNKRIIKGVKNTEIELETTVNKDGNIVIKWKKSKGYRVDSFEILRAVKKNGKYSKIYTTKSGKASRIVNAKNLKDGKRYYYKVRGVRTIDGKKYYTEWSDIESKKVKK